MDTPHQESTTPWNATESAMPWNAAGMATPGLASTLLLLAILPSSQLIMSTCTESLLKHD